MKNKTVRTRWNPAVDNKPEVNPRSRFMQDFSGKYLRTGSRILDVGCGIGNYIHLIDRKGCFGTDLEINALKVAKKYCINSDFLMASVLDLPFRDETFDLVAMWEVIEHIPPGTERQAISEIRRVLTSCGAFLLSTPNRNFISNIMDPAFFLMGHRHYDVRGIVKLITDIGFSVKQCTIRGRWSTLIATNIFYFNKHVLRKKGGKLHKFFEGKSENEFNSKKTGVANIFIAAKKVVA
jgi:SAM-dependent methyltransferase